jgi:hypothetical protein
MSEDTLGLKYKLKSDNKETNGGVMISSRYIFSLFNDVLSKSDYTVA